MATAKCYVFQPPATGGPALASIYANSDGAVVSIPWSADNPQTAALGGWETSAQVAVNTTLAAYTGHNTSANAAYNKTTYPAGFTGTTWIDTSRTTMVVNSNLSDDSLVPITPCHVSPISVKTLIPAYTGKWYAHMTNWFGTGSSTAAPNHMDIGVDCDTTAWVTSALNDMQARGFDGCILDWYGSTNYVDKPTLLLKTQIATM